MEKNIFSIYKISLEKTVNKIRLKKDEPTVNDYLDALMNTLKSDIKDKSGRYVNTIDYPEFKGIVYRTEVSPKWKTLIENMAAYIEIEGQSKDLSWIVNTNVSYILFHVYNNQIYAMTGGYGHNLITEYIERNWGLYLVTKLVKKDETIIRQLKENYLYGNTSTVSKANRNNTNFVVEKELSAIYNEIFIELDDDGIAKLGINTSKKKNKTGVQLKDSLYIRKSMTLTELKGLIKQIDELEQKEDNFSLNYFMPIRKSDMTSEPLKRQLIEDLKERKFDNIQLMGDDYIEYCVTSDEYYLMDGEGNVVWSSEDMMTIESIFAEFDNKKIKITKHFLNTFLMTWKIYTKLKDDNFGIRPVRIYDAIQGFVEEESSKMPYYIFQGQWYSMDKKYEQILDDEFVDLYKSWEETAGDLKERFELINDKTTEDAYNVSFYHNPKIIVAHTVLISNFEIADLFFWDDNYLYIMCNKSKFNGSGSRDLMNQIRASSLYLQTQMQTENREDFLNNLYDSIESKYKGKNAPMISRDEFETIFTERQYFYVAGYMEEYKQTSNSSYAKCLTVDFNREMTNKGFKCIVMGLDS